VGTTVGKQPVNNTGIVIDFANSTVSAQFFSVVARIRAVYGGSLVQFDGYSPPGRVVSYIEGNIDRATGVATVMTGKDDAVGYLIGNGDNYYLTCKMPLKG
jgi:hypothetical protein